MPAYGRAMSPALQAILVFSISVLIVVGVLVTIALEVWAEHENNVERRRLPTAHH